MSLLDEPPGLLEGRHAPGDRRRADFERDGVLVLRGVFSPSEMVDLADEADRLLARSDLIDPRNLRCRFMPHHGGGEPLFEVFDPVADIGPVCARFCRDDRLLGTLASIYGDTPRLFKDKLIFKLPGARGYEPHQDIPRCWEGFPATFVTVLVPIDAMTADNGGTEVWPGHHRRGFLPLAEGSKHALADGAVPAEDAILLDLAPGDVAIFGGMTPHRSAPNRTGSPRRALYLSYNADHDGGDQRDRHYGQFHEYLLSHYAGACCDADVGPGYYFR